MLSGKADVTIAAAVWCKEDISVAQSKARLVSAHIVSRVPIEVPAANSASEVWRLRGKAAGRASASAAIAKQLERRCERYSPPVDGLPC